MMSQLLKMILKQLKKLKNPLDVARVLNLRMLSMTYSIEFYKDALKYLQKLDRTNRIRITQHLQILCEDPYHPELDIKRMQGTMDEYRLRVGSYRIIYSVENNKLLIRAFCIIPFLCNRQQKSIAPDY
ncbi:type II toxin-antitoxin system RelE/ParE family toxin [Paenibacillus lactis]|uniref:type II toxin-antitoxin system RelE family toxin n=2 Tax=Paenibacillus lactis TaxID=228574 RepID=UPI0009FE0653